MDNTEKSEYLFNKLKGEKECNHKTDSGYLDSDSLRKYYTCHSTCGKDLDEFHNSMDFFSPPSDKEWEYFGWMWERMKNRGLCTNFLIWSEKRYEGIPFCSYLQDFISCTALAEALYEWFEGGR